MVEAHGGHELLGGLLDEAAANGQKWNYKEEVTHPSLKVLLTYIYSHTYGSFAGAVWPCAVNEP